MKIRLDQYLVQHGMIQSRERAKALIMAGVVFVNEQKVDKAGEMIKEDAKVEVRGHDIGYVSRGGLKLEKAMQCFPLTPAARSVWTLVRPRAALPTVCCRTVPSRSMLWMWDTASWHGACAPTSVS